MPALEELRLEEVVPAPASAVHLARTYAATGKRKRGRGGGDTYDASWLAFISTARNTFGPTPRASEPTPSSRTIYTARESDARVGAEHARRTSRATITITTENIK